MNLHNRHTAGHPEYYYDNNGKRREEKVSKPDQTDFFSFIVSVGVYCFIYHVFFKP